MATIRDVGRAAHVSIATVSRVVNGDRSVHPGLRRLVEEAIEQLGYRPNAAARSLRLARTGTIGVVVPDLTNPTFTDILHGVEQVAAARGRNLFICDAAGSFSAQSAHLDRLYGQRVDGILIHPLGPFQAQIAATRALGIPVVVMGQRAPSGMEPEIVVDEADAARAGFRLLFELGHRRIGMIIRSYGSEPSQPMASMPVRLRDYRAAHDEAGIPVDESLLFSAQTLEEARRQASEMLARPDRPTALIAGMHRFTPGMLLAIREAGLRMPRDVSLLAHGDSLWANAFEPPISVIRLDYSAFGRRAAELFFAVEAGEAQEQTLTQRSELVVRRTCVPARLVAAAAH
ncbi:MAG TPA: LacI family DNA-binding transcriptional regulator [Dehalococcoidia bacterium]|nr:LacI family DNA-binding transcriptional regulator [Dehalococcoidia bacterium]